MDYSFIRINDFMHISICDEMYVYEMPWKYIDILPKFSIL